MNNQSKLEYYQQQLVKAYGANLMVYIVYYQELINKLINGNDNK